MNSPYAFRDSDRVQEIYEQKTIKNGIDSPFRQTYDPRLTMARRTQTPKKNPIVQEDNACFITQTNYIFPNILNRTRDHLDLGRYKASRSVEHSRGIIC